MKKVFYNWQQVQGAVLEINRQMLADNWVPDYIVGITRGGLVPANLLSQYTGIKMYTLDVSLRDSNTQPESNLWMAEDAFGYETSAKNILIIDDINDSGATLDWIVKDWESTCLPGNQRWDNVWHHNVRTAVLTHNTASNFKDVDYCAWEINKSENDCWIVYPWEEFWLR